MNIFLSVFLGVTTLIIFVGVLFILFLIAWFIKTEVLDKRDKRKSKCTWILPRSDLDNESKTSCGNSFHDCTESGEPVTDWVKYCPYCGGEIRK